MPIFLDSWSALFKYFHAYQNPNGGKNKLIRYTTICLDNVVAGGLSLNGLPQLEQKYAIAGIADPHDGQVVSGCVSINILLILPKNRLLGDFCLLRIAVIAMSYLLFLVFFASNITFFAANRFLVLWDFDFLCLPSTAPALFAIYVFYKLIDYSLIITENTGKGKYLLLTSSIIKNSFNS